MTIISPSLSLSNSMRRDAPRFSAENIHSDDARSPDAHVRHAFMHDVRHINRRPARRKIDAVAQENSFASTRDVFERQFVLFKISLNNRINYNLRQRLFMSKPALRVAV